MGRQLHGHCGFIKRTQIYRLRIIHDGLQIRPEKDRGKKSDVIEIELYQVLCDTCIKGKDRIRDRLNTKRDTIESDVNETVAGFNYRDCSYATSSNGRFGQGNDSFLSAANNDRDDVKSMNFDKFYPQIFVEGQTENEFWTAFWNAHIRNCGIEDENYIANFIAEWKDVPPGRIWSHTVTNRPSGQ